MSWEMDLNDQMLEDLYEWIDSIPLSRQKKRIERDFSDGFCVAEIVHHFLPNIIDMHNYTPAYNITQKQANWGMLNSKVFSKFGLNVPSNITQNISNAKPGYIEVLLHNLRYKVEERLSANETQRTNTSGKSTKMMSGRPLESTLFANGKPKKVSNEMRLTYEGKVQECLEKDEIIESLNAKVRRLEHLLYLKDARIRELATRLDKYRPTAVIAEQINSARQDSTNYQNDEQNYDQNNYDGEDNFQGNSY
jgi:hypothetical protein